MERTIKIGNSTKDYAASGWVHMSIILAVVAAIMLPIAFVGIPDGYDLTQHIRFAAAYHDSILTGDFVPSWAADDNFGFGSIGIRYYPPLAYYVLAVTKMLTGNWYDSFWIDSFGWMLLGCLGVYYWAKEWLNGAQATFAAVIYALAPYHTFQIYQAVLFSEFAAAGILPFCFLFLTRVCRRQGWADTILFSISYALLVLTHIPSTIIASPCMAIYVLLILDKSRLTAIATRLGSAFVLALSATAFHLSKLLTERDWVLHNSPHYYSNGYYDFHRYFFPMFYSSSAATYGQRLLWQLDIIIALTFLLFLPVAVYLIVHKTSKSRNEFGPMITRALLPTGLFSLFMLTVPGSYVWQYIPILQKIQFPWRWLLVASLFASVSFAFVIPHLVIRTKKINRAVAYPAMLFVLLLIFADITQSIIPSIPLSRQAFQEKIDEIKNETGCECWWPIWAKNAAFDSCEKADAGLRNIKIADWSPETRELAIDAGDEKQIRIATFYHPHWKATVNGLHVPVAKDENGAIVITLPSEPAALRLYFQEPTYVTATRLISFVTWILFTIFVVGLIACKLRRKSLPRLS